MKRKICGYTCASALLIFAVPGVEADTRSNIDASCSYGADGVSTLSDFLTCGTVSGTLRSLYYSTHNAYFNKHLNQDTISYGGSINYTTAVLSGFQVGLSGVFLRGINHGDNSRTIRDIGQNQNNLGEAWLSWQYRDLKITAGDQRLTLPFMGDYDWRITPILYRALDVNYGDKENFLRATKVWRYKPWGDDNFLKTTAFSEIDTPINGMWGVGAGRGVQLENKRLTGQIWYQEYDDYVRLVYGESHLNWQQAALAPDIGVQFIRGTDAGKALAGEVNSTSYGTQLALTLTPSLSWKLGYNHIAASGSSWKNGALVLPYAHNTASGPYFAQPYFTSTQDLGSGNAWATGVHFIASENLTMGARYAFMDLKPSTASASINQSEYLLYASWAFDGALKGISISNFAGVQTSPLYDHSFWQNRLTLQYRF
ncbi:TonB-dependent receptor [Pluralibacter gergoviae]|uniref:TonB-dependent receptor n=1 Tax=Pluralibacter gergoviae TaxID=61647 RepID=UPI002911241A|nr:TonB-dependent receptor [Pluralibacter gergoviae]MDU4003030.1 TonB-dependent receptor [Pluralibacter gergoviae]